MNLLLFFILPIMALGLGWELVLADPQQIWYWFILVLASGGLLSFSVNFNLPWRRAWADRVSFMVLLVSVFWWLLWLDFSYFNYVVPVIFWLLTVLLLRYTRGRELEILPPSLRLAMFLASSFFASSLSFGLVTVLGYPLYLVLIVFLLLLALPTWAATIYLRQLGKNWLLSYLFLLLVLAEFFTVLVWLPFTEITLGLVLTIVILAFYDLLKYFVKPELTVRRIIVKKIIVYAIFLLLVLFSTPWL
ncbi:MAG: hypothetical protein AAB779_01525 [Patescibacteria group bacterium]